MEYLIRKGADVNAVNDWDQTPLHQVSWQLWHRDASAAELLIARGADPEHEDNRRYTPLHIAVRHGNFPVVELLLRKGANVEGSPDDQSPLLTTVYAEYDNPEKMAQLLIDYGAKVDSTADGKHAPLRVAAQQGQLKMAALLLNAGANPLLEASDHFTPFHVAVFNGNIEMTRLLLQKGADINSTSNVFFPAIYIAAQKGNTEMIKLLIANGANVNLRARGWSPLQIARNHHHEEATQLLEQHGAVE